MCARHVKTCAKYSFRGLVAPEAKPKPWKPGAAEHAGPSDFQCLARHPGSSSGAAVTAGDVGTGKSEVARINLLDCPPLGEVQFRGVHSNARSLVRVRAPR